MGCPTNFDDDLTKDEFWGVESTLPDLMLVIVMILLPKPWWDSHLLLMIHSLIWHWCLRLAKPVRLHISLILLTSIIWIWPGIGNSPKWPSLSCRFLRIGHRICQVFPETSAKLPRRTKNRDEPRSTTLVQTGAGPRVWAPRSNWLWGKDVAIFVGKVRNPLGFCVDKLDKPTKKTPRHIRWFTCNSLRVTLGKVFQWGVVHCCAMRKWSFCYFDGGLQ